MSTPVRVSVAAVFLASLVILPAAVAQSDVADQNVTPGLIQWRVRVPNEGVSITVSRPDGETVTKESKSSNVSVTLQELGGGEGTYIYQLTVTPPISSDVKDKLKLARKNNDERGARKLMHDAGLDRPIIQSGAFTVLNGAFLSPDTVENPSRAHATTTSTSSGQSNGGSGSSTNGEVSFARRLTPQPNDQVIPDDLIVQGSLCVGLDCVVNESFSFDTIRLKENNTRVKFDDTSTSAGFPNTDWQLTANDSASGGASKFSIEDITNTKVPFTVLANALTNSIFVSSSGKVGFRTSTPVLDLHINTSDTPAVRFEQNNSGGFTAQTWDVAGNEANFFVRDVTGGSRLPFRIRPGAPTSSIDVNALGNVGIGTASPTNGKIDVKGSAWFENATTDHAIRFLPGTTGGSHLIDSNFSGSGSVLPLRISANAGVFGNQLYLQTDGNIGLGTSSPTNPLHHSSGAVLTAGGVWQNASSRDIKFDICDLDGSVARETLKELEPITFAYRVDPQEHHVGFIAEDVPDLVASKDRKSLSAMDIVAVLTKVVQEQQKTIETLSKRIEQLEKVKQ